MARGGGGHSGGGSRGGGGFSSSSSRGSRGFSSSSMSGGSRNSYSSGSRGSYSAGNRGGYGGSRPGGSGMNMGGGPRPGGTGMNMGGGYCPRTPRPPVRVPIFVSSPRRRNGSGGGCSGSLFSFIALMIILCIMFSAISSVNGRNGNYDYNDNTKITSTVEREALPSGSVNETGYYTDNLGVISRSSTLTSGMKSFYKETGVQPYLYLASEDEVAEYSSLQILAETMYDELFTDEAHLLCVYTEDDVAYGEWELWFVTGTQATSVIDEEAEEIIFQYFSRYYYDDSLSYEEFFSKAFEDAGELMMKHVTNGFDVAKVAIMIVGGVAVIGIVVYGVNKSKKIKLEREKEQNEFTERMMNVPLETFSEAETDKELEELMKKYKESESK